MQHLYPVSFPVNTTKDRPPSGRDADWTLCVASSTVSTALEINAKCRTHFHIGDNFTDLKFTEQIVYAGTTLPGFEARVLLCNRGKYSTEGLYSPESMRSILFSPLLGCVFAC